MRLFSVTVDLPDFKPGTGYVVLGQRIADSSLGLTSDQFLVAGDDGEPRWIDSCDCRLAEFYRSADEDRWLGMVRATPEHSHP